jgi:hypothetical protein
MDMGEVKQELQMELREHGNKVGQGMEAGQNEKHLQQLVDVLMAELQRQAAGHKTDMHGMTSQASQEQNTLPIQLQHTERIQLRNEIATEIKQLEELTQDQDQELNNLRQSKTPEPQSSNNPRMATTENKQNKEHQEEEERHNRSYEEGSRTSQQHDNNTTTKDTRITEPINDTTMKDAAHHQ